MSLQHQHCASCACSIRVHFMCPSINEGRQKASEHQHSLHVLRTPAWEASKESTGGKRCRQTIWSTDTTNPRHASAEYDAGMRRVTAGLIERLSPSMEKREEEEEKVKAGGPVDINFTSGPCILARAERASTSAVWLS